MDGASGAGRMVRVLANRGLRGAGRRGIVLAVWLALPGLLALGACAASAETLSATCSNLQAQIEAAGEAKGHGEGDVIVLNGMCDAANLKTPNGVSLPSESNFTLEGAPGTTSGFDGAGVTGGALLGTVGSVEVGSMTFGNLTFRHASFKGDGGALAVRARSRVALTGDSFLENATEGVVGGAAFIYVGNKQLACPPPSGPAAIQITGSTFRGNKLTVGGGVGAGGAMWMLDECETSANVLEGDTFEGNTLEANGSTQALGGGLAFDFPSGERPSPVTQRGNVFDANRVLATAGSGNYGGAGEWLEDASVTSVDDRFSRNSLSGTSGPNWSWGAGLAILNSSCNTLTPTESTLENAVVTGNTIGAGTPADLGGAGIYLGCSPSLTHPNHLRLLDSTVTENSVAAGGVAGVAGNPGDQLQIANSIVAGDSGGSETGGFNGPGGSITATYSDLCAPGSSSPIAGTGNICANPLLADNGNPASFDVHETGSSPTLDAGSNELAKGLATDFYGEPRIMAAHSFTPACAPGVESVGPEVGPAIVDMGASEYGPIAVPAIALLCPGARLLAHSVFAFPAVSQRASGALGLSFKGLAAGRMTVLGTFKVSKTVLVKVKGHDRRRHKLETVVYGRASFTTSSPGSVTIQLKPGKRALALLAKRKHLSVLLSITFTATGELPTTHTQTITVKYVKPHRKHHG